jgi:hypothetical protein
VCVPHSPSPSQSLWRPTELHLPSDFTAMALGQSSSEIASKHWFFALALFELDFLSLEPPSKYYSDEAILSLTNEFTFFECISSDGSACTFELDFLYNRLDRFDSL